MLTYLCGEVIIWVLFWFTGCLVQYSHLTSTVQCSIRIFTAFPLVRKTSTAALNKNSVVSITHVFVAPLLPCCLPFPFFSSDSGFSIWFGSVGSRGAVAESQDSTLKIESNKGRSAKKMETLIHPHLWKRTIWNSKVCCVFFVLRRIDEWSTFEMHFWAEGQVPCVVSPTLVSLMGICRLWLCWAILWFSYAVMKLRTNTKFRSRHIQLTTDWRKGGSWWCCQVRCWHIPPPNKSRTWISRLGSLGKNIMIPIGDAQASWGPGCEYPIGSGARATRWIFHDSRLGPNSYSHTIHVWYICLHLVDVIVNVGK